MNERPGVYTSYTVSKSRYRKEGAKIPGVVALGDGDGTSVTAVYSTDEAKTLFGDDSNITKLIEIFMESGVSVVKAVPVSDNLSETYASAFELIAADETVKAIVCDSDSSSIHSGLMDAIMSADSRSQHKLGIVECGADSVQGYITAAENLNCERMVLCAPGATDYDGNETVTGALAAAFCGAVLTNSDPALPLNGAKLMGIGGVTARFTESEINSLVRGGVTVIEKSAGDTAVLRAVTTRTKTGGAYDSTWRELTTILIVDDVIPTVRDALRHSFLRSKNTAQTRGAIRSCVVVELEKKVTDEIIESYGNITVAADEDDPTVCNVSFEFTVVHGINRICLTAYITV